jgi:hypothetical protein
MVATHQVFMPAGFIALLFPAQIESVRQCNVPIIFCLSKIGQQAPALTDHFEQAAPAGFILAIDPEVFSQLIDAARQDCHLDFRGSGISFVAIEILDRFCFNLFGEWHDVCFLSIIGRSPCL